MDNREGLEGGQASDIFGPGVRELLSGLSGSAHEAARAALTDLLRRVHEDSGSEEATIADILAASDGPLAAARAQFAYRIGPLGYELKKDDRGEWRILEKQL